VGVPTHQASFPLAFFHRLSHTLTNCFGRGLNGGVGVPIKIGDLSSSVSAFDVFRRASFRLEGLRAETSSDEQLCFSETTLREATMPLYEHVFLARQDVSAQQVETMTEQFKGIIEAAGGQVSKIEYWGVKSLAYRIKKNRKAHFALINITSAPAGVAEMERQMKINEDVIRFMTIKVEALEEGPSAMMQRREREERRDRERTERRDEPFGYDAGEEN
jgi:small subunit ribosomal protein S6